MRIGNVLAAYNPAALAGVKTIVNCSDSRVYGPKGVAVYVVPYADARHLPFGDFAHTMNTCLELIKAAVVAHRPVLVVCEKGVNRSVSVAVAHLIREHGMHFQEAINKIEARKAETYGGAWNSLTNFRIRNLLKALCQNKH